MPAKADYLKAADIFASVLDRPAAKQYIEREYCRIHRRAKRLDLSKMTEAQKARLGRIVLRRYSQDNPGAIDWSKFQRWCQDHKNLIAVIRLAMTLLFMFCI